MKLIRIYSSWFPAVIRIIEEVLFFFLFVRVRHIFRLSFIFFLSHYWLQLLWIVFLILPLIFPPIAIITPITFSLYILPIVSRTIVLIFTKLSLQWNAFPIIIINLADLVLCFLVEDNGQCLNQGKKVSISWQSASTHLETFFQSPFLLDFVWY